jgi:hypothetical protein
MREQITINAVRDSRSCIGPVRPPGADDDGHGADPPDRAPPVARDHHFRQPDRRTADPANRCPRFTARSWETLEKNNAPPDIDIIYGSAHWANAVLEGKIDEMTDDSTESAIHWTRAAFADKMDSGRLDSWSGMPRACRRCWMRWGSGCTKAGPRGLAKSSRQGTEPGAVAGRGDQVRILESDGQLNRTMTPQQLDRTAPDRTERKS